MRKWISLALLGGLAVAGCASAQVDIAPFVRKDAFGDIQISPDGRYLAATVPKEDRTGLVIMQRADHKISGSFTLGKNTHVSDLHWINDERVVFSVAEKFGALDQPRQTGELFAIDADGGMGKLLVGFRVAGEGLGTRIQARKAENVAAFLSDGLDGDDRNVLVSIWPFSREEVYARIDRMDVYTGRRIPVARAPVQNADFTTDNAHEVRFAQGAGSDRVNKLYYRGGAGADWTLLNDQSKSGRVVTPLGFSADNATAYLQEQQVEGPDAIIAWDIATDRRRQVLRGEAADPMRIIHRSGTRIPIGALVMGDTPRSLFFDEASPEARTYHSLEAAFGGRAIEITSSTGDGRVVLVKTWSGNDPGDFYTFDTVALKADHLLSHRSWFDPELTASVQPIALKARDGLELHGYLTLPHGSGAKGLPLVVMPHGGPYEVYDAWQFDSEAQLLAAAGYAVLQINFRGSGNYGRAFLQAGARQWGGRMQDDVTDATAWAIAQGIADPARICIYGASYGGYSALMGVAREPALYKCAAGYVGVYDLPLMFTTGDIQQRGSGETYLREWIGDPKELAAVSPVNLAERIKVPVFLAAGGQDQRAPIQHSKRMEAALRKAGVPVETLYVDSEGHGFYTEAHQREYYTRLLAFLARSLGGQQAAPAQP